MTDWVDVRNWDKLMCGFQISSREGGWSPGVGDYLKELIEQNQQIINLLRQLANK